MTVRVDRAVTSGTFSLDGQTFDVDNNVWVIGDDEECVVIDAPHDVEAIRAVIGDRRLQGVLCTHAHDDHVRVAPGPPWNKVSPVNTHPRSAARKQTAPGAWPGVCSTVRVVPATGIS